MKKIIIILLCLLFISCNTTGDENIIINKTAQELTAEFLSDWEAADNFYKGKMIMVTGYLLGGGNKHLDLGERPILNNWQNQYNINDIEINCEFDVMVVLLYSELGLKQDQRIIIKGEYHSFLNSHEVKILRLINCEVINFEPME